MLAGMRGNVPGIERIRQRIAANLRAEVARAGVPVARIAEHLNISRGNADKRLRGQARLTAVDVILLAELLNVSTDSLLDMGVDRGPVPRHQGPGILGETLHRGPV